MKKAIKNQTTQKLELHFTKEDYLALSTDQKSSLKSAFLWSKSGACWVSRAKLDNCYHANKTAEKLGFDLSTAEVTGKRLSYAEELEVKTEKAEHREERYLQYAENAEKRAENLQKAIKDKRGDIAFFTQPILAGHAGSQTFARQREKMFSRYEKGFEEYRKSEYFRGRALTAAGTASKQQLQNKTYLYNRIFEPKNGDFTSTEIDNTSYIDPSKYNYIFAETSAESQNFWVQIGFGIESRRVMSAKQIPNL